MSPFSNSQHPGPFFSFFLPYNSPDCHLEPCHPEPCHPEPCHLSAAKGRPARPPRPFTLHKSCPICVRLNGLDDSLHRLVAGSANRLQQLSEQEPVVLGMLAVRIADHHDGPTIGSVGKGSALAQLRLEARNLVFL